MFMCGFIGFIQNIFRKVYGQNNFNINISICGQQPWGTSGKIWPESGLSTVNITCDLSITILENTHGKHFKNSDVQF